MLVFDINVILKDLYWLIGYVLVVGVCLTNLLKSVSQVFEAVAKFRATFLIYFWQRKFIEIIQKILLKLVNWLIDLKMQIIVFLTWFIFDDFEHCYEFFELETEDIAQGV